MINLSEFIIEKIEDNIAILIDIEDHRKISWPIKKLPISIKIGDKIKFKISTDQDIELEQQVIARKLLEEMIN